MPKVVPGLRLVWHDADLMDVAPSSTKAHARWRNHLPALEGAAERIRSTQKELNLLSKVKYIPQPIVFAPLSDMALRK
ncbi:hypothetical protein GR247_20955 [Rhizobium leguminosarum]|nr:hypothetical protein [Rhizobium leguminosarum]